MCSKGTQVSKVELNKQFIQKRLSVGKSELTTSGRLTCVGLFPPSCRAIQRKFGETALWKAGKTVHHSLGML